jgi:phage virion morphogenesis protein
VRLTVDIRGVKRDLRRMLRKIDDQTELWEAVGFLMDRSVKKNFYSEGRPDKWTPLSPARLKQKLPGKKILQDFSDLVNSITAEADSKGVTIATNKEYGAIHQFGGEAGRKTARVKIPARPYLLVQDEDHEAIAAMIERYLAEPMA